MGLSGNSAPSTSAGLPSTNGSLLPATCGVRRGGAKLGYLWREPGWSHDGSRETSDAIRARWLARWGLMRAGVDAPGRVKTAAGDKSGSGADLCRG